jgi:hypothetical protein
VNTRATTEAIRARIRGEQVSRFRAVAMAATAGTGIAVVVYRSLRD